MGADGLIKYAGVNEPRFDHNPVTGESLGLLVEEARTNLLMYSEQFDDNSWSKVNCTVTANATTGPSGAFTADKLIPNVGTVSSYVICSQSFSITSGAAYTQSWFVKADGYRYVSAFEFYSGTGAGLVTFDLQTGTVSSAANGATTANGQIITLGNGWFRVSYSYTATSSGASPRLYVSGSGTSITSVTGDGTSGVFVWGAQLEAGAFPTSYIPTTTAAVTRSADVASITGTNFSSWYRQDEGTLFMDLRNDQGPLAVFAVMQTAGIDPRVLQLSNGVSGTAAEAYSSGKYSLGFGPYTSLNTRLKMANAMQLNNVGFSANGATALTDASFTPPTVDRLSIGFISGTAVPMKRGTISRLTYWPKRLPNSQLQTLTR